MRPIFLRAATLGGLAVGVCRSQTPYAHFEARHTHPIALSPDGTKLFALNSPDARLSVFDVSNPANPTPILVAEIPVGLEPVSVRARNNDEVWVVNELSDSVSVVSIPFRRTIATLRAKDEPADVVFAQGRAFVSCARSNEVRVFDTITRAELTTISVDGLYPRALAVNAAGSSVFGAFLLSGNGTTILPHTAAPNQPAPTNASLPTPPKTALIVPSTDPRITYAVTNHDVVEINTQTLTVSGYHGSAGTNIFDLAVHPVNGDLWIANTEALNLTRFEPVLRGHFVDNRLTRIARPSGVADVFDLNLGVNYSTLPNPSAQSTALAQPTAILLSEDGTHAWLAAFASDRIAKIETTGSVSARVDLRPDGDSRTMRGPRGLTWNQTAARLYVLNKLTNSISVVDTAAGTVLTEVPVGSHDPMPTEIKAGRGFLFDARLSGNGTASCASCHLDADCDGLAWDLGDPGGDMSIVQGKNISAHDFTDRSRMMHPMKGPMTTQTLRGLHSEEASGAPFHWRGDRPTLQSFNPTYDKLMGGSQLSGADIDALVRYLESLRHHPNPFRNLDGNAPALHRAGIPSRGRNLFNQHLNHCGVCHLLPSSTDNNIDLMNEVGSTQPLKNPSLLTVYQRVFFNPNAGGTSLSGFGLLHDGTGSGLTLPTVHPYVLTELANAQEFNDVAAFVLTLDTGTAPAIGYEVTVDVENRVTETVLLDINKLEIQATRRSCDVVVRGVLQGRTRSFTFSETNFVYVSDDAAEPALDSSGLRDLLGPGDMLSWMGVPYGQGRRFGVDRNENTILDANEPLPTLNQMMLGGTLLLTWPRSNPDWYPETIRNSTATWSAITAPRSSVAGQFLAPLVPEPGGRAFFRLRRTW